MCVNCANDEMSVDGIKAEMLRDTVGIFYRMRDPELLLELAERCEDAASEIQEEQRMVNEFEREFKQILFNEVLRVSKHRFQELFELLAKMIDNGDLEYADAMAFLAEAIKEKQEKSEASMLFRF